MSYPATRRLPAVRISIGALLLAFGCQVLAQSTGLADLVLFRHADQAPLDTVELFGTVPVRLLNAAPDGRQVAVATLEPGWVHRTSKQPRRTLELLVLEGELLWDDVTLGQHDYGYLPTGAPPVILQSGDNGVTLLMFADPPRETDGHQSRTVASRATPWRDGIVAQRDTGQALDLKVKDLLWVEETGQRTWLLRVDGDFTIPWEAHESVEEGFLIYGDYRVAECLADGPVIGNYRPGGYFYRPPGIVHSGPESGTEKGALWLLRTPTTLTVDFVAGCPDPTG